MALISTKANTVYQLHSADKSGTVEIPNFKVIPGVVMKKTYPRGHSMKNQFIDFLQSQSVEWLVCRIFEHNLNAEHDAGSSDLMLFHDGDMAFVPVNDVLGVIFQKLGRPDLALKEGM